MHRELETISISANRAFSRSVYIEHTRFFALIRPKSGITILARISAPVTYPGAGNYSQFAYDGLGRNVLIQEYTSSTLTSTKQFVCSETDERLYQPCEVRDAASSITAQFLELGLFLRILIPRLAENPDADPQFLVPGMLELEPLPR
jgi:hypothetical protein